MGKRLGELLVERGWISGDQLIRAIRAQRVVGGLLGTCLLELGALSEERLLVALSDQAGVPPAGADDLRGIPDEIRRLVPAKLAISARAIPFRALGGRVDVAMVNVRDIIAHDELAFVSGKRVQPHVAAEVRIFQALERYYGLECPSRYAHILDRLNRARVLWQQRGAAPVSPGAPPTASPWLQPPAPPSSSSPLLRSPEHASAAVPEAPAAARPLEELSARLTSVAGPDEVGRAFLDFLSGRFADAALFRVRRGTMEGWMGRGEGIDQELLGGLRLDLRQPSIFLNLRHGGDFHLGPLPVMAAHEKLAPALGPGLAGPALFLPVRLKDQLVVVGYGGRGSTNGGVPDLDLLRRAAAKVAVAFELCIMRSRLRRL